MGYLKRVRSPARNKPHAIHAPMSVPLIQGGSSTTRDLRRRTEITPVKDSHTKRKGLALTNGHVRYKTVTPERVLQ